MRYGLFTTRRGVHPYLVSSRSLGRRVFVLIMAFLLVAFIYTLIGVMVEG